MIFVNVSVNTVEVLMIYEPSSEFFGSTEWAVYELLAYEENKGIEAVGRLTGPPSAGTNSPA
jgi:hypothetical protein